MLASALLAACSSDGGADATPTAQPTFEPLALADVTERGPYAVGFTTYELVDTSRPTQANGGVPESPERKLTTEVWYPAVIDPASGDGRDATADLSGGPYPLIIFAHGLASSRLFYLDYTEHLASHGYIVAAPDFPLTSFSTPGGTRFLDTIHQAADVSFVIDRMLEFNAQDGHLLHDAIDAESIGLTGHSGGGFTTLLAVYGVYGARRDDRIDAALPISASGCFYTQDEIAEVSVPMMFMIGSEDLIVPRAGNRAAYDMARAPRYWVELLGGNHIRLTLADVDDALVAGDLSGLVGETAGEAGPDGGDLTDEAVACFGDTDPAGQPPMTIDQQHEALRMFATPFFDAYLKHDPAALHFLQEQLPSLSDGIADYDYETEE